MRRPVVLLALLLSPFVSVDGAEAKKDAAPPPPRFSFVAMGCLPYRRTDYPAYERLLAEINRHAPAFTVHCGDTKWGSEPPTEELLGQVKAWFDSLEGPLMYSPGDNEWTDVIRENNGRQDPLVWLARIRKLYFAEERSLGKKPLPLITQRRDPVFAKFVENARWSRDGVVFATVHVVGSNNNCQPEIAGALEEFRERDQANAAWIKAVFAEARATQAPAVAFFFQAEPFASLTRPAVRESGFTLFLETMEREAKAFDKPVLLVHADEHRYRLERGMKFRRDGEVLANVTRLGTFGDRDVHAVLVTVDPAAPQVFLAGPLIVPSNALPVLPRKK
jgi:hypothetical protein